MFRINCSKTRQVNKTSEKICCSEKQYMTDWWLRNYFRYKASITDCSFWLKSTLNYRLTLYFPLCVTVPLQLSKETQRGMLVLNTTLRNQIRIILKPKNVKYTSEKAIFSFNTDIMNSLKCGFKNSWFITFIRCNLDVSFLKYLIKEMFPFC